MYRTPINTGVGATHRRPLEVALCYGIYADVRNPDDS